MKLSAILKQTDIEKEGLLIEYIFAFAWNSHRSRDRISNLLYFWKSGQISHLYETFHPTYCKGGQIFFAQFRKFFNFFSFFSHFVTSYAFLYTI